MGAATAWPELAAVILAGGGGTRVGGRDKPSLLVGGVAMLDTVLGAVAGAGLRIVVGPPRDGLPEGVRTVRESPAGAGPAAATAVALALIPPEGPELVGVFAADLPHLTAAAVGVLIGAISDGVDGAVFVDGRGKRQLLCGVWRAEALRGAVERLGEAEGKSMRAVFEGLVVAEVGWGRAGPAPYYDCDTDEDLRRAEGASA
ncbi:NTP transferase domain-containing protein [Dactylosporangium sp. NPDC005555]|uniref:molybdenum cofactor guanylyltransferase n=1 Tax=Dactylosporangium sp. NPDC005555 TaxID=3154889 RepID=UPI0033B9AD47